MTRIVLKVPLLLAVDMYGWLGEPDTRIRTLLCKQTVELSFSKCSRVARQKIVRFSAHSTVVHDSVFQTDKTLIWCVCFVLLPPIQPSGVMSCAVSLPNHTFTGQA